MNKLLYISVGLYFEVKDSEMYGGIGSIGYVGQTFGGVGNIEEADDAFINRQIEIMSATLGVSPEKVRLISKEEYDQETGNDDSGDFDELE